MILQILPELLSSCLQVFRVQLLHLIMLQGTQTESDREGFYLINNMIEHGLVRLVDLVWRPGPVQHLIGQLRITDDHHLQYRE